MKVHSLFLQQHTAEVSGEGMRFTWHVPDGEVVLVRRAQQGTIHMVVVEKQAPDITEKEVYSGDA